jgi:hypothetical protein
MRPTKSPAPELDPPLLLEPELERELELEELEREPLEREPPLNDCPPPGRIENNVGGATLAA